jgi:hypothetical protein
MKTLLSIVLSTLLLVGCSSVKMVGDVNMLSTRNVDSNVNYELIKTGTDDSKTAFRKTKATNIDQAVNNLVLDVPGGEFVKNVKIYTDGKKWAVIGDVWGLPEQANVEGYRIGDSVYIKNSLISKTLNGEKFTKAKVTGFKDKKTCLVTLDSGEIKEANYSDLSKTDN